MILECSMWLLHAAIIANKLVGKTVGGESLEVSMVCLTDFRVNLEYFDTNFMGTADCGQKL